MPKNVSANNVSENNVYHKHYNQEQSFLIRQIRDKTFDSIFWLSFISGHIRCIKAIVASIFFE